MSRHQRSSSGEAFPPVGPRGFGLGLGRSDHDEQVELIGRQLGRELGLVDADGEDWSPREKGSAVGGLVSPPPSLSLPLYFYLSPIFVCVCVWECGERDRGTKNVHACVCQWCNIILCLLAQT